jgi:flagellar basal-body rod protein FlgC
MKIEKFFSALNVSARGMSAQRARMNAVANNIANAETTRTEDGTPYRRKIVTMQSTAAQSFNDSLQAQGFSFGIGDAERGEPGTVEATESVDMSDFKMIHDPTHPDADENGYVKMPNINIVTEMVDMMSASRAYEANVTVINAQKQMAKDSLEI